MHLFCYLMFQKKNLHGTVSLDEKLQESSWIKIFFFLVQEKTLNKLQE